MKYKIRPGVVFTEVCGSKLLVPDRRASEACPYIIRVPKLWAAHLQALSNGTPVEKIYRNHSIITKKSIEESREIVDQILAELANKGFIIPLEDEE